MNNRSKANFRVLTVCTVCALLVGARGWAAQPSGPPDWVVTFPADLACAGFDLQIEGWNGKRHDRQFTDKNGTLRVISAGTGAALRYTNVQSGATFSTKSSGAVDHTIFNLDGSQTKTLTGHNVVFMFPTDTPPGPSTTLYAGRVVLTIDPSFNFTVEAESGKTTDICAAVSQ